MSQLLAPSHTMIAPLQLDLPRHRTWHAIPAGHCSSSPSHSSLSMQSIVQTPASQVVHSGGQTASKGSTAIPQPSTAPPAPPSDEPSSPANPPVPADPPVPA